MNSQERQLVDDLFDRLARLESSPRDRDASAAIADGLRKAPNALYGLVQTVLVQDEALKQAEARLQALEARGSSEQPQGGFLDSMREALFGRPNDRGADRGGSVPNVRAAERPAWNAGGAYDNRSAPQQQGYGAGGGYAPPPPSPGFGGGSFLGTAAAAAAGVVGGSLIMNSMRGMMGGGGNHQSFADASGGGDRNPWSSGGSNSELSRDAGLDDIGSHRDGGDRQGFFDQASNRDDGNNGGWFDNASNDSGGEDFGGDAGGDSDYA